MLLRGKRGLGLLLAGILFVTMPAGASASDIGQEQILPEETAAVIDFEKDGYVLKLTGGEQYEYTGKEIEPEFVILHKEDDREEPIELEKDTDYTAEYHDNIEISSGSENKPTLIVEGISDGEKGYKGTLKVSFEIVGGNEDAASNDSSAVPPEEGTDAKTDIETGFETDADTDIGTDDGLKEQDAAVSVNDCTVTLSAQAFYCDGKAKTPAVTVRHGEDVLVPGTDYTVSYENNVNAGEASAVITGIGRYTGTKKAVFAIKLGAVSLTSSSSYSKVSLSWGKVPGAAGYEVYKSKKKTSGFKLAKRVSSGSSAYADKDTKFNQTYYYRVRAYCTASGRTAYGEWSGVKAQKKQVAPPHITRVKISSGRMKITWKKVGGASGYALYRSTSEDGKYKRIAVINKGSKVSYTDKKASKGKVYYYKARAYRQVKKKKYYGQSSAAAHNTVPKNATSNTASNTASSGSGWRYVNGYKLYYDKNGKLVKDVSKIIGKQSSYVIKVNKKKNCVTVYAKDGKKGYIIPVKAFPCSAGKATPITTARTPAKYRWHELNGNCYGQWCTRIKQGYLFHSVMYGRTKNTSLSVSNYNKLGRTASHGCIRLRAGDAKWIYDNCKLKTKVVIYNSSNPGPLGKPSVAKLPKWHRWDPTDPTARAQCARRGCH